MLRNFKGSARCPACGAVATSPESLARHIARRERYSESHRKLKIVPEKTGDFFLSNSCQYTTKDCQEGLSEAHLVGRGTDEG